MAMRLFSFSLQEACAGADARVIDPVKWAL